MILRRLVRIVENMLLVLVEIELVVEELLLNRLGSLLLPMTIITATAANHLNLLELRII